MPHVLPARRSKTLLLEPTMVTGCMPLKQQLWSSYREREMTASPLVTNVYDHCQQFAQPPPAPKEPFSRSEEHTSELQSRPHLVCRLLLEKKKHKHCISHETS